MGVNGDGQLALPAPKILVDALPYIDGAYNDPAIKSQVHALIEEEMKTFKPEKDYLAPWPMREPDFSKTQLLESEWMRVCAGEPMPKMDTSRYQIEGPPEHLRKDPEAWKPCLDNARAHSNV